MYTEYLYSKNEFYREKFKQNLLDSKWNISCLEYFFENINSVEFEYLWLRESLLYITKKIHPAYMYKYLLTSIQNVNAICATLNTGNFVAARRAASPARTLA